MHVLLVLLVAFVSIYPAALVGGIVQGTLGDAFRPVRWLFCVIAYLVIGGFAVSLVL